MFSPGLARRRSHRKWLHCEPDAVGGNLIGFGEHPRRVVVGQIDVAEDGPADGDRHREKSAHRRVVLRKPHGGRVRGQVSYAQSRRVEERQAQKPLAHRQLSDAPNGVGVDSLVDKPEQVALGIAYGQGAVRGGGQFPGREDDPVQHYFEVEVRTDLDEDAEQLLHLVAARQQLVELLMHPANEPTLGEPGESRAVFVAAGHPTRYLHDNFS